MKRWQIFLLTPLLTATLAFPTLTGLAVTQDRPCAADAQKLCKGIEPGNGGGILQCLKEQEANLSDGCKARLQTSVHEPCAEDAAKLCKDVEPGHKLQMVHCLREHETDLSDACKQRLQGFWGRVL